MSTVARLVVVAVAFAVAVAVAVAWLACQGILRAKIGRKKFASGKFRPWSTFLVLYFLFVTIDCDCLQLYCCCAVVGVLGDVAFAAAAILPNILPVLAGRTQQSGWDVAYHWVRPSMAQRCASPFV